MKPTVHDIARQAGVSLATVDRVLNSRPGVRGVTRYRVEEAIAALGYVRDVAAANLAKSRTYAFVLILPDNDNSFMAALRGEAAQAVARAAAERTALDIVTVPPFDAAALAAALKTVEAQRPAGVAFVAVESDAVRDGVARLKQAGIAVATLVSDLSQSPHDHFVGIDNVAAGRTAAGLMGRFLPEGCGPVAVLAGSMLLKDHRERLDGFLAVLAEEFPELIVLPAMEAKDDPALAERLVTQALQDHPDLAGIYSLGAGNRGLIAALRRRIGPRQGTDRMEPGVTDATIEQSVIEAAERSAANDTARQSLGEETIRQGYIQGQGRRRPVVIAHELTASTRSALTDGLVDAVLNQDAGHEIRSALRVLKAKADGLAVIDAQERIRIDIFMKDNLP